METEGRKDVHAVAQPYEVYDVFTADGFFLCKATASSEAQALKLARTDGETPAMAKLAARQIRQRLPIYVFAVPSVFPGEFSVEAESEEVARAALLAQFSDAQRNASLTMIDVWPPQGRASAMQPMGVKEFRQLFEDWQRDPCYELSEVEQYAQHQTMLGTVQSQKEVQWLGARFERENDAQQALKARSDAAGVSVEVMTLSDRAPGCSPHFQQRSRALSRTVAARL